jgi:4-hydroxybenzoate polyprenyltransferase
VFRALAESARVSNLPTVWTNALVGGAAVEIIARTEGAAVPRWTVLVSIASLSMLYTGGMILNDAVDAGWDAEHGKDRPIPAGRLSRRAAFAVSGGLLGIGAGLPIVIGGFDATVSVAALALLAAIVLYDLLHKRSPWTALLMAACRGLVYVLAAAIAFASIDDRVARAGTSAVFGAVAAPALALVAYTALLTLAARREDIAGVRLGAVWAWLLPVPYLVAALAYRPDRLLWTLFVAAAFLAWTTRSARLARAGRIPGAVSGWLAGICLADALLLMLMNRLELAPLAVLAWLLTVTAQRRIAGT